MTDRRIITDPERYGHNALKEIAGRLQKLSYRDIKRLAAAMDPNGSEQEHIELVEMLLTGSDSILEAPCNNPQGAKSEARYAS